MNDIHLIEESFNKFIKKLDDWIPDGIYVVNLELLHHFDLLHFQPLEDHDKDPLSNRYFHILETFEKMTLINDEFIIWIIPDKNDQSSVTHTLIALNKGEIGPQLEAAFITSGVYNHSRMVLKILEKFLIEIHETEITLSKIQKLPSND